jgi:hypothetical protein
VRPDYMKRQKCTDLSKEVANSVPAGVPDEVIAKYPPVEKERHAKVYYIKVWVDPQTDEEAMETYGEFERMVEDMGYGYTIDSEVLCEVEELRKLANLAVALRAFKVSHLEVRARMLEAIEKYLDLDLSPSEQEAVMEFAYNHAEKGGYDDGTTK